MKLTAKPQPQKLSEADQRKRKVIEAALQKRFGKSANKQDNCDCCGERCSD